MTAYRRPLIPAVTVTALLLTACNTEGTTDGGTTTTNPPLTVTSTAAPVGTTTTTTPAETDTDPTTTVATTTTTPAADNPTPDRPLGTPAVTSENREPVWVDPPPLVTGIRVGRHENFTRVVYDLIGDGEPGWITQYIDQPYQQGSGFDVDVAGEAFLMVNITGTTYPFEHDHEGAATGPYPGTGVVEEVYNTGTFEGHTLTYIGLEAELPYSVTLLQNPLRVVVDIQHK
ncbi:hypothetical protein SAMN06295981_0574 [Corynebacterium pollutisoli]|uniref:AMIN-like domain-containing protein n=1 Tax=Corynebacterium pollutisoli TaxID=1610489 RepID=A0A1X7IAH5_9CORY|nr:hypothetical protein [Corynebacterium pollutisoli]SMG11245.1 hypothetical protein SAMN06295981_0574 [Corynebacterium pollutisoli]